MQLCINNKTIMLLYIIANNYYPSTPMQGVEGTFVTNVQNIETLENIYEKNHNRYILILFL